jgi:hypothetical protein
MTNLLILSSHGVLEYDDLRLFSRLGYDVFMPGGYADPTQGNHLRPAVPEAPRHPELAALVEEQRERHAGEPADWPIIDWGKADLHPKLIDWADIIMVNCFPESWIGMQWARIREKRVIWRTIGQSDQNGELAMRRYRFDGLQIVRYSPAEKRAFERMGVFAGEDAVIRFGKDPADYGPWIGDHEVVGNLAQHDTVPGQRDPWINWPFVLQVTEGLPREFVGTNAETVGGRSLDYPDLMEWLRRIRCLIYTGTQPASYTLGLMEAMLTGTPVVSIGPQHMWLPDLFEAHELAILGSSEAQVCYQQITRLLSDPAMARNLSARTERRGRELFSYDVVGPQWTEFLGAPVKAEAVAA